VTFNDNLLILNQDQILSRPSSTLMVSCSLIMSGPVKNIFVSSANIILFTSDVALTRSLMYNMKSNKPKIDP